MVKGKLHEKNQFLLDFIRLMRFILKTAKKSMFHFQVLQLLLNIKVD